MGADPVVVDERPWYLVSRRVVDGTGSPAFEGTLVITGDRLTEVRRGRHLPDPATDVEVLDVGDAVVAPGFIDLHTHSDVSLLSEPGCISAIGQGVTTQVVGHCGFSAAPVNDVTKERITLEEPVFGFPGVDWSWESIRGYLAAVDRARPATNVATLVGHNTVRRLVMGGAGRAAGPAERDAMVGHLHDALADGAAGVTTGLSYSPGFFADAEELAAVAGAAAAYGRRYHTHMRYGDLGVRGSLEEAIATARAAGAPLNVSHLYPGMRDPADEAQRLIGMLETARDEGMETSFDLTVFQRGGGAFVQSLPGWAREGGLEGTIAMIQDRATRDRLAAELATAQAQRDWDDALIVKVNDIGNAGLLNRSIGAIARERGVPPEQAALDLIVEDGQFWIAPVIKRQQDLDLLMSHPSCIPITDGMSAHPVTHRDLGVMPKTFGSFALVLGSYVRERGVLRLEEAVERMTRLPAERIGLDGRGTIAAGNAADLVVLDPARVTNRATEDDPVAAPDGFIHVIVGGRFALREGVVTGQRDGRALVPGPVG